MQPNPTAVPVPGGIDPEMMATIVALQQMECSGIIGYATQCDTVRGFCIAARGKGVSFIGDMVKVVPQEVIETRMRIIAEEVNTELLPLLQHMAEAGVYSLEQQAELLDHLVDSVFVILGAAVNFGLPFDAAFRIIAESNMQKVVRPGGPVFREDGKVLKPEGWEPPTKLLFNLVMDAHKKAHAARLARIAATPARPENEAGESSLMGDGGNDATQQTPG